MSWSDSSRRENLIRKFTKWKMGTDNPMHDRAPLPITNLALKLSSEGGRTIKGYVFREDTDPTELVDVILEDVEFYAEGCPKGGSIPSFVLWVHFDGRKAPGEEIPLQPNPKSDASEMSFPAHDLREPKNQAATIVSLNVQQAMHKDSLFYGTMTGIIEKFTQFSDKQERLLDRRDARIEALETKYDKLQQQQWEREEKFRALEVDLEIKRANAHMMIKLKQIGAEALMPILSAIGANLIKKTGGMMGIEQMDVDETQLQLAQHIASDPNKIAVLMDGMDDDLKQRTIVSFQALQQRSSQKKLTLTAQAGMEGVTKPIALAEWNRSLALANRKKVG